MLPERLYTALGATPRHYGSPFGEAPFKNLVPSDEPLAVLVDESLDAAYDIALELEFVAQSFRRHTLVAARTQQPV